MSNKNIRTTLKAYLERKDTWFFWYHDPGRLIKIKKFQNKCLDKKGIKHDKKDKILNKFFKNNGHPINDLLFGFLDSTLDEARLKKANDFAFYALYISDKRSFSYFRRAESKREISGEVDYDKQRDHAVHTLYNYLLGWYIFDNLPAFRKEFINVFERIFDNQVRINFKINDKEQEFYRDYYTSKPHGMDERMFFDEIPLVNHFGDIWPLTSLLHDVGYILEGSLSPATPKIEHERVTNGSKVLHDYSNHWLWKHTEVDFRAAINIARILKCVVPNFKESKSMPALADRLRDIGNLENIRKKGVEDEVDPLDKDGKEKYALNREAFHLWDLFYRKYMNEDNKDVMSNILNEVKYEYMRDVWEGGIKSKINLNHGVCGGLMLLQSSTFWYDFMWGLQLTEWDYIDDYQQKNESSDPVSKHIFYMIRKEITDERIPAHIWLRDGFSYLDWIKDLWATASVAIHDYVTQDTWNNEGNENLKIDLRTDPLAYLEILVDVLQEWDRYTVLGESAFSEVELLQSYETHLLLVDVPKGRTKLRLTYPKRKTSKNYKEKIEADLRRILKPWGNYVDIREK